MKLELPKVSVITPSYNQGRYLDMTIRSVLAQDYPNLEYIVLDGASTDNSREVIEKYENHLTFWRSKPDDGQAAAIAEGFSMATGHILCWINSDDVLLPGALKYVGKQFAKCQDKIQWMVGSTIVIDENNYIIDWRKSFPVTFNIMLAAGMGFWQQSCFWRKSLYDKVGGIKKDMRFCFDYDLFVKFARVTRPKWVNQFLGAFRFQPEAKTAKLEDIRQAENRMIREYWNVKMSKARAISYWLCKVVWGKLTTKYPKEKTALEWPPDNVMC